MYIKALLLAITAATALADVHIIEVGDDGLVFDPPTTTASVGDTIIFELFDPHNVAQADFSAPCVPSKGGFFSGDFSESDNGKKKFVYNVTTTDPIYFYCSVVGHCQAGFVGGINLPSSGNTLDAFASAAKNTKSVEPSGGPSGGELEDDSQLASLTASAPSASGSPTAASSSAPASDSSATTTPTSTSGITAPQHTGAADRIGAPITGVLAALLGFAAWVL